MTATGGVGDAAAGGALCPIPPRATEDSREEEAGGAKNPKSITKVHEWRFDDYEETHERQLAAQRREEHWPAAEKPQEEGSLAAGPREAAQECSRGARAEDCWLVVESQRPVVPR